MKLYLLKLALVFIPFIFTNDITQWKIKSSSITFKIKNAGVTVDGSLVGLKATIKFDPIKVQESSISASIESNSISTDMESRDNHLRKADYLDVEKYPLITLQSTKIEKTGPITFKGIFKLTIKDVTKEISIPFTFMKLPDKTEFKGSFIINRRDYGVGGGSMILSEDANITIVAEVTE